MNLWQKNKVDDIVLCDISNDDYYNDVAINDLELLP